MNTAQILNAIWGEAKTRPVSASDAAELASINVRYAREVLGLMERHGLIEQDSDTMEYTAIENVNAQQVQTVIDALKPSAEADATPPKEAKSTKATAKKSTPAKPRPKKVKNETGKCLCGCGTNSTSNYRPGHDARHAGQIARAIVDNRAKKGFDRRELLAVLPSDALKAKAENMAGRMLDKLEAAAKAEVAKKESK